MNVKIEPQVSIVAANPILRMPSRHARDTVIQSRRCSTVLMMFIYGRLYSVFDVKLPTNDIIHVVYIDRFLDAGL